MRHALSLARRIALPLGVPLVLLLLWEFASRERLLNPLFFPPPSQVAQTWWRLIRSGTLLTDTRVSLVRVLFGFALGAVPAVALGMAMGLWQPLRSALLPTLVALYPIPRIAILPLVLVLFGLGESSKLFMVAFSVFFLLLLETVAGVQRIDPVLLDVARSVRVSRWRLYRSVAWPGSLPAIATGARLGMGFALIVIVGTEFVAARNGLGARIWLAYQVLDMQTLYAGLVTTVLLGWALDALLSLATRLAIPWAAG